DALVFTGGIGENSVMVRKEVCSNMEYLGIILDDNRNENVEGECLISSDDSKVKVFRIPTNEELVIALDTEKIVSEQLSQV
ncbi:MAG: acetate kinase, partial [Melioribacter sp.]|nr:acetate kinase [Melioribacter sp.]